MSRNKRRAARPLRVVDQQELENGDVRLTFTGHHNLTTPGQVLPFDDGPLALVSVENRYIATFRPVEPPDEPQLPFRTRARLALRVLMGRRKKARA